MNRRLALIEVLVALLLATAAALADDPPAASQPDGLAEDATVLDEPIPVYFRLDDKSIVQGKLLAYDGSAMQVAAGKGQRLVRWSEITPPQVYQTRKRLIDKEDAQARFQLGRYCWHNDLKRDALAEFGHARRLDPGLADRIEAVILGRDKPDASAEDESSDDEPDEKKTPGKGHGNRIEGETDKDKIVRFSKPTPEQIEAAREMTKRQSELAVKKLRVKLDLVETDHFYILTDWPDGEHKWLRNTCEGMYRGLAGQFGVSSKENIWYGKLAIFAFGDEQVFRRFAREVGGFDPPMRMAGYAQYRGGFVYIALWKTGDPKQVSSLIVHEGTHAFLARYRSNAHVISWLNEGLAQWMEHIGVSGSRKLEYARMMSKRIADSGHDIRSIFKAGNIPGQMYPVALTLTDLLLKRSKKRYVSMIHDIKEGMSADEALKKNYGWSTDKLARLWQKWASRDFK
jgi:hypothetical protein